MKIPAVQNSVLTCKTDLSTKKNFCTKPVLSNNESSSFEQISFEGKPNPLKSLFKKLFKQSKKEIEVSPIEDLDDRIGLNCSTLDELEKEKKGPLFEYYLF